jgi:hypothetical protein
MFVISVAIGFEAVDRIPLWFSSIGEDKAADISSIFHHFHLRTRGILAVASAYPKPTWLFSYFVVGVLFLTCFER